MKQFNLISSFPFVRQQEASDCGPACIKMIAKHHGRSVSMTKMREYCQTGRRGSSIKHMSEAAEELGFRTLGVRLSYEELSQEVPLPCIIYWRQSHYVVVYQIKKNYVYIADPAQGLLKIPEQAFIESWVGKNAQNHTREGIALLLEPTPQLLEEAEEETKERKNSFQFLFPYVWRYRNLVFQLAIGIFIASALEMLFPFLTQSIVDVGIKNRDIDFIILILVAQVALFVGKTLNELIRSWVLLHLSTRINISLVSDFFIKLMRLPISFFDTKMTGDILQRIGDHARIKNLMTITTLNVVFSTFTLVIFSCILAWYHLSIFLIFLISSLAYMGYVMLFMKRRETLDYLRFERSSEEKSKVIELVNGMQEIKIHNAERQKRWGWEYIQARLFKIEIKSLILQQTQSVGAGFINEMKNILILFSTAWYVVQGDMTLGMMLAVSYIIGQLSSPIENWIGFSFSLQDARIALDRLSEIHNRPDEEKGDHLGMQHLNVQQDIYLQDISFTYPGGVAPVLRNIDFCIPQGKMTAIVGASGSGKTTLMKLLLRFYEPEEGKIELGMTPLSQISPRAWRSHCGVVMQEGYIFNDTIANNIALGEDTVDKAKLRQAVEIASIRDFIERLPMSYNTKIGAEGVDISTGQKQRLLIARAVYKNPAIILFDEATNSLDAKNEKSIVQNLNGFLEGKTSVVIAHRLSTVKHADQIVVINKGQIAEKGTHQELIDQKGYYYRLVKDQLELEKKTDVKSNNHHPTSNGVS
ncbi:MAG: peptidase domain-containing ABC transporter [Bacteroidota bacterium]